MIKVDDVDAQVWCRDGNYCMWATPCEEVECPHKESKTEVLVGIRLCHTFQITTPASRWEYAYRLSNDLSKIKEEE